MKNGWNSLSQPVKTMILVWVPVIVIAVLVGTIFGIRQVVMNHQRAEAEATYDACVARVTKLEAADIAGETTVNGITYHNADAVKALQDAGSCQPPMN